MLAKVFSCAVIGLDGAIVEVEVDTANGLPNFVNVGSARRRSSICGKRHLDRWQADTQLVVGYVRGDSMSQLHLKSSVGHPFLGLRFRHIPPF